MCDDELQPWPALTEICDRIQALSALLYRTQLEMPIHSQDDVQQWYGDLNKWIERDNLIAHFSNSESELIAANLGGWTESQVFETVWRFEALLPLLWAIKRIDEMPSWEQPVGAQVMENAALFQSPQQLLEVSSLRDQDELEQMQHGAEFWHWRLRTEMMRRDGVDPPPGDSYQQCIGRAVDHAHKEGIINSIVQGDIGINGTAYANLPQQQWADIASLSIERHYGLNWLTGRAEHNDWDLTRTDT